MRKLKIQRNFKDRVFRLVFQEKKDLLELYNAVAGRQYQEPDVLELKLSDAFVCTDPAVTPCLECKAMMLNINYGHNRKLMEQCRRLRDYALFVKCVRENAADGMALTKAVDNAVTSCIRNGILADILSKNRAEVRDLILYEYDEQKQKAIERREGFTEGEITGEQKKAALVIRNLLKRGMPDEDICRLVECSMEAVEEVKKTI